MASWRRERSGSSFVSVSTSPLISIVTTTEAAEIVSSFGSRMEADIVLFLSRRLWV